MIHSLLLFYFVEIAATKLVDVDQEKIYETVDSKLNEIRGIYEYDIQVSLDAILHNINHNQNNKHMDETEFQVILQKIMQTFNKLKTDFDEEVKSFAGKKYNSEEYDANTGIQFGLDEKRDSGASSTSAGSDIAGATPIRQLGFAVRTAATLKGKAKAAQQTVQKAKAEKAEKAKNDGIAPAAALSPKKP